MRKDLPRIRLLDSPVDFHEKQKTLHRVFEGCVIRKILNGLYHFVFCCHKKNRSRIGFRQQSFSSRLNSLRLPWVRTQNRAVPICRFSPSQGPSHLERTPLVMRDMNNSRHRTTEIQVRRPKIFLVSFHPLIRVHPFSSVVDVSFTRRRQVACRHSCGQR